MSGLPVPMTNLEALEALTHFDPPNDEPITRTNRLCDAQWRRDMAVFAAWLRARTDAAFVANRDNPWLNGYGIADEIEAALNAEKED